MLHRADTNRGHEEPFEMNQISTDVDYQNNDHAPNEGMCDENVLKANTSHEQSLQLADNGHYDQIYGKEQSDDAIYGVPKTSKSVKGTNVSEEEEKSAHKSAKNEYVIVREGKTQISNV